MQKKYKWRKWLRIFHRDLGYFFVGMTLIYAISGIAINHKEIWNVTTIAKEKTYPIKIASDDLTDWVDEALKITDETQNYHKHYTKEGNLYILLHNRGSIVIDTEAGAMNFVRKYNRPFFKETHYLHYDPIIYWSYFSDFYAVALIYFAISGLIMVRGKKGFKWRGAILSLVGILIPIIFLMIYYY